MLYYVTCDKTLRGRASNYFRDKESARMKCKERNLSAIRMELLVRYDVAEIEEEGIDPKEIRK